MKNDNMRCKNCGKFVGYHEFDNNITVKFTPDTQFTTEKTEYHHINCDKK